MSDILDALKNPGWWVLTVLVGLFLNVFAPFVNRWVEKVLEARSQKKRRLASEEDVEIKRDVSCQKGTDLFLERLLHHDRTVRRQLKNPAVIRFHVPALLFIALPMQALAQVGGPDVWDGRSLPVTIEVTRDVPVKTSERRADGTYGQDRGSLYSSKAFIIRKGQRFRVVGLMQEGTCRIEFEGSRYELNSCPWMPGFRDSQTDTFRIVEFRNR